MTPDERKLVDAIKELSRGGVNPSMQELATHLGLQSKSTVHRKVHNLAAEGVLDITSRSRGIRLREPPVHIVAAIAEACSTADANAVGKALPASVLEQVVRDAWMAAL